MTNILKLDDFAKIDESVNIQPVTKERLNSAVQGVTDYDKFKGALLRMISKIKRDPRYRNELDKIDLRVQFDTLNSDIYTIPSNENEIKKMWADFEDNLKAGNGFDGNDGGKEVYLDAYYNDETINSADFIDYSMTVEYTKDKEFSFR